MVKDFIARQHLQKNTNIQRKIENIQEEVNKLKLAVNAFKPWILIKDLQNQIYY